MGWVQILFFKGEKIIKKQPQTLQYSGLFTLNRSGNRLLPLDTTTNPSGFFQNFELVIIGTVSKISPWWKSKTKAYLYSRTMILVASSWAKWNGITSAFITIQSVPLHKSHSKLLTLDFSTVVCSRDFVGCYIFNKVMSYQHSLIISCWEQKRNKRAKIKKKKLTEQHMQSFMNLKPST